MNQIKPQEIRKELLSGEVLIRTDEGIYFLAANKDAFPLLIDEREGMSLLLKEQQREIEVLQEDCAYWKMKWQELENLAD